MASIKIPTPLRAYTGNQSDIDVQGSTVSDALNDLVAQHPDLAPHLFQDGKLRNFVNIFLGDENISFLDGLNTDIDGGAKLRIVPTIAGGC
jgi:molybdopterin converting factor small subunit